MSSWELEADALRAKKPDPAAVTGEDRLQAFRDVRDELQHRLTRLFEEWPGQ